MASSLIFIGLIESFLKRERGERVDVNLSRILKFSAAMIILFVGYFGHELHAFNLLMVMLGALIVPMGYSAVVWIAGHRAIEGHEK